MLVTSEQQTQVAERISDIEQRTDAEIVCVLASRSDHYQDIVWLISAILAFASPLPALFFIHWFHLSFILFIQLSTFLTSAFILHSFTGWISYLPKSLRYSRSRILAHQQFFLQNLHHTKDATGVLIFMAEAERYVEIIADRGIHQHVPDTTWQNIVDALITHIKAGNTLTGLLECLDTCGNLLEHYVPATNQKNELPNRLILI